jgi:hypothetical protein
MSPSPLPAPALAVTEKSISGALAKDSNGNPSICATPATKSTFLTTDPQAGVWLTFDGAHNGDVLAFRWIHPSGTVDAYQPTTRLNFNGSGCAAWFISVNGGPPAAETGVWQVEVQINGDYLLALPFTIR